MEELAEIALAASLSLEQQRGMTTAAFRASLPVAKHRLELLYLLERHPVVIVVGSTGSGKTTQIPQFLHEAGWTSASKMIACTQPRRVAATSVAGRVAEEMGCEVGELVGYGVRFEDRTDPERTRIKYMTDGTLFREAMFDPLLGRYSVIMIDEAHERSLHTDLLMGLLKKIMRRRPELKIVISSASLDARSFADYFRTVGRTAGTVSGPTLPPKESSGGEAVGGKSGGEPAVLSLEGRTFPIHISFLHEPSSDTVEDAVRTVVHIASTQEPGDILVFLTGRQDIELARQGLFDAQQTSNSFRLAVFALHASLPLKAQLEAFQPVARGLRKVILATNIAETSVTIDGIVYVVDGGRVKRRRFLPAENVDRMEVVSISKSSAMQRAGRAGRSRPGWVYRLYTEAESIGFEERTRPQIQLVNLVPVLLQLKALGIDNLASFDFMDRPSVDNLAKALEHLFALGAIDKAGLLTDPVGRILSELPVEPALGKILIASKDHGCAAEALSIVSMMAVGGGPNVFLPEAPEDVRRKLWVEEGDLLTYLNVYNAYLANQGNAAKWCARHGLNLRSLEKAQRARRLLAAHLQYFGLPVASRAQPKCDLVVAVQKSIAAGLFMNVAHSQQPEGSYRRVGASGGRGAGSGMWVHPDSVLFKRVPDWVVFSDAVETTKTFIRDLTVVKKEWLHAAAPHYFDLRQR